MSILLVLTLVLAIACISLGIAYSRGGKRKHEYVQDSVAKAAKRGLQRKDACLPAYAASSSSVAAMVAQVRQHVYALHQINELTTGIYGRRQVFIDEALLSACDEFLNECDARIQGGSRCRSLSSICATPLTPCTKASPAPPHDAQFKK